MATLAQVRFAGLSTETKPATLPNGADIPVGSGFDETDTGARFYWDGGQWVKVAAAPTASATTLEDIQASNRLILRELRLMRQGLMKSSTCAEYDGPPEELDEQ